jgi:hypothetical protein
MEDVEIRLETLKLSAQIVRQPSNAEEIIRCAAKLLEFVLIPSHN